MPPIQKIKSAFHQHNSGRSLRLAANVSNIINLLSSNGTKFGYNLQLYYDRQVTILQSEKKHIEPLQWWDKIWVQLTSRLLHCQRNRLTLSSIHRKLNHSLLF